MSLLYFFKRARHYSGNFDSAAIETRKFSRNITAQTILHQPRMPLRQQKLEVSKKRYFPAVGRCFLNNNQTTLEWRPDWYRLPLGSITFNTKPQTPRVSHVDRVILYYESYWVYYCCPHRLKNAFVVSATWTAAPHLRCEVVEQPNDGVEWDL